MGNMSHVAHDIKKLNLAHPMHLLKREIGIALQPKKDGGIITVISYQKDVRRLSSCSTQSLLHSSLFLSA